MNSGTMYFENPVESQDPDGIVGRGGTLDAGNIVDAYTKGIFPWPQKDGTVLWMSPKNRGILKFSEFRIEKSLFKEARDSSYRVTYNRAFTEVIHHCQSIVRKGQTFTWITDGIIRAYSELHRMGYAHSVECWEGNELAGGLYGVWGGRVFTGESMFTRKKSASKFALIAIVEALEDMGVTWIDTQIVSHYIGTVGGRLIERERFYIDLEECQERSAITWPDVWLPAQMRKREGLINRT